MNSVRLWQELPEPHLAAEIVHGPNDKERGPARTTQLSVDGFSEDPYAHAQAFSVV